MSENKGQMKAIGKSINRIDGVAKVTGAAKYSSDFREDRMAHGVIFGSTISSGTIRGFDLKAAKAIPGVVEIITYQNAIRFKKPKEGGPASPGENFIPLQDNRVHYNGQHIGVVVAETLEAAMQAVHLIKVRYNEKKPSTDIEKLARRAYVINDMPPIGKINSSTGNFKRAVKESKVVLTRTYTTPIENHNPMEPSATMVVPVEGGFKVYDSTQGVAGSAQLISQLFGLTPDKVQTITKFVGGGFGCKGSLWGHQVIAVMAAQKTKRPIKLALTRQQMFTGVGHRAHTIQKITLGADANGKLHAVEHDTINNTATNKDYSERCGAGTAMLYQCDNINVVHRLVKLNYQVPTFMRAPGHSSGSFALESAMDELAEQLKIDPLEIRLRNYAETDPHEKKAFSSKSLRECYLVGAEKFGWKNRPQQPGSKRDGEWLIGYGMATATYPAKRFPAAASVELFADGTARVLSATQDIGTGTYTVMTQVAAEYLGLDINRVRFDLGDSRYPMASVSGGSTTMASVGTAIRLACENIGRQVSERSLTDSNSPLFGLTPNEIEIVGGRLQSRTNPGKAETILDFMKRNKLSSLSAKGDTKEPGEKDKDYSGHSFGAHFVEARVHSLTGEVRMSRLLGAFAAGQIINPLTARSQYEGGIVWGVGMGLMEETVPDLRNGRFVIRDLGDYHVPVQADIPKIDVIMVHEEDKKINPIGVKGIGEISITGLPGAIANAVYNATGVRVRDLPLTPDKIMAGLATKSIRA